QQFARPKEMFDRLRELGFYPCFWLTPFVNKSSVADMAGSTKGPASTFVQAAKRGYLVRTASGEPMMASWWKGEGALIDFTNIAAVNWWQNQVARTLPWGAHVFKCDGGEGNFIPDGSPGDDRPAAVFHDGTPPDQMKNRY